MRIKSTKDIILQYEHLPSLGHCSIESTVSSTDEMEDVEMELLNKNMGLKDGSSMSIGLGE